MKNNSQQTKSLGELGHFCKGIPRSIRREIVDVKNKTADTYSRTERADRC